MPEKRTNLHVSTIVPAMGVKSSLFHQWRFSVLTALLFVFIMTVLSMDGCTVTSLVDSWKVKQTYFIFPLGARTTTSVISKSKNPDLTINPRHHNAANFSSGSVTIEKKPPQEQKPRSGKHPTWVSAHLEKNFTSDLISRWSSPSRRGVEGCKDSKSFEILIPGLDKKKNMKLSAGEIHEFEFQSIDESGNRVCSGGDYFETDLSSENWKSRPLVKDLGNGSYSVSLQVHPDFSGVYNLTINLLFRSFEGLKFSPTRFAFDKQLRKTRIQFYDDGLNSKLPALKICKQSDFTRDAWSGRWTRHGKNDNCLISKDGRFRCLNSDFPCKNPWCNGSLGALESNGWVYSGHCSFNLFSSESAWNCLQDKWIFFWGDSNHVDSIRNMLNFVLGRPEIPLVPRRFDLRFTNPKNESQSVRITSIFNGHSNVTQNYEGLDSLSHQEYRDLLKKYFFEEKVPDTIVMNSGLHDGIHWHTIRAFSKAADYAASFWKEVMESISKRGLKVPHIIFRNTIATGGYARLLAFNPSKLEAFNGVLLEKLRRVGLVSKVIDNFDMTFPWHFDNRCNDGVHYGRAPAKARWRDGEIGHQYFVDLMLVHVLLNAICAS